MNDMCDEIEKFITHIGDKTYKDKFTGICIVTYKSKQGNLHCRGAVFCHLSTKIATTCNKKSANVEDTG